MTRARRPRPPVVPALTAEEAAAAASAVHAAARQAEAWARDPVGPYWTEKQQADYQRRAAALRGALLKLIRTSHPDFPGDAGEELARKIVESWDKMSNEEEALEAARKGRQL